MWWWGRSPSAWASGCSWSPDRWPLLVLTVTAGAGAGADHTAIESVVDLAIAALHPWPRIAKVACASGGCWWAAVAAFGLPCCCCLPPLLVVLGPLMGAWPGSGPLAPE